MISQVIPALPGLAGRGVGPHGLGSQLRKRGSVVREKRLFDLSLGQSWQAMTGLFIFNLVVLS